MRGAAAASVATTACDAADARATSRSDGRPPGAALSPDDAPATSAATPGLALRAKTAATSAGSGSEFDKRNPAGSYVTAPA